MWSLEQLEEVGALVVAGYVHFDGQLVSGMWTENGFQPADGGPLHGVDKPKKAKEPKQAQ